MESTLKMRAKTTDVLSPLNRLQQKLLPYWNKWGIWVAIVVVFAILCSFTDFGDFMRGFNKGFEDAHPGKRPSSFGAYFGVLVLFVFLFCLLYLCLLLVGQAYYILFHQHVFRKNEVSYTVLYVLLLILFWNLLSNGLAFLLDGYKGKETIKPAAYTEMLASVFASMFLLFVVVYGFIKDYRKHHKAQALLLQQKTQAELDALKAQVNPHFLFNTLNNLYGTALAEDSPRTAESIHQLSGIVRYVMEEANSTRTDVQRELRFIDDYVELQRMRIPRLDNIRILVETFWDEQPAEVMPLLLNPLIENAFKYGISIQHPCFVEIRLRIEAGVLTFSTRNSVVPRTQLERSTGLGVKNVQKRLALAYPGRHEFSVSEADGVFTVMLKIDLNKT